MSQERLPEEISQGDLIEQGVAMILQGLGVDSNNRNFKKTPERYRKFLSELFSPTGETQYPVYNDNYSGWIVMRNHVLWTLCPHHLLPVRLKVTAAYIPHKQVVGLSKLARMAQASNTGPLMQETFTRNFADTLSKIPGCGGAAVVTEGTHACMRIRGIKSNGKVLACARVGAFERSDEWNSFVNFTKGS